jgi:copper chaperone CopZ
MKFSINFSMPVLALILLLSCAAKKMGNQIANVKIYGNCGMCEKTIEAAAFQKGVARADWNRETKIAKITFNASKTTVDAVLQRIAAAGYDSDQCVAPDAVYAELPGCCQYDRPKRATSPKK